MNFNEQLICVDRNCNLGFCIINSWQDFIEHQNLEHKMLTSNQFFSSLKQKQDQYNYSDYEDVQEDLEDKALRILDEDLHYLKNIIYDTIEQTIENLRIKCTKEIQNKVDQCFKQSKIDLNNYQQFISFPEYQQICLNYYNSNYEKQIFSFVKECTKFLQFQINQICQSLDKDFQSLENQLTKINQNDVVEQQQFVQQNQQNYEQKFEEDDTFSEISPLKGYKKQEQKTIQEQKIIQEQPIPQQINASGNSWQQNIIQNENMEKQAGKPRKKQKEVKDVKDIKESKDEKEIKNEDTTKNNQAKKEKKKQPVQKQQNQKQVSQSIDQSKSFQIVKPNFLLTNTIRQICVEHQYGNFVFTDQNQGVIQNDEGLIYFEGMVHYSCSVNFKITFTRLSGDYFIEIGMIDWNTFVPPKLKSAPQKGVYSINSLSCVYNDGKSKTKNNLFQDNSQFSINYNSEQQILAFQTQKLNQSIKIQTADGQYSFYAQLKKAEIKLGKK